MNILQIISLALVLFVTNVFSQDNPFVVDVAPRITNGDTQLSFVAFIPDANISTIETKWMKYVAKGSRGKATFANGIHHQTSAVNPRVSSKPFDVSSKLTNKNNGVQLVVWMDQDGTPFRGDGTRNNGDLAVQNYVREFSVRAYRIILNNQLSEAQSKLRMLEKDSTHMSRVNAHHTGGNHSGLNNGEPKKGKPNKQSKLAERDNNKIQEQLTFKKSEIESQQKIISDTKVKLVEIR